MQVHSTVGPPDRALLAAVANNSTLVRLLRLLQGPRSYFYASLGWANIDGEGQGGAEAGQQEECHPLAI